MKLYIYDHCPYCVRARMIFGLKNMKVEEITILNDDEATPVGLVGKKVVPVLVKNDGSAMPESLDIVRYIDGNFGEKCLSDKVRPELEQWMEKIQGYYYRLLMPRFVRLGLAEYASQSALSYFISKKTEKIGDFEENFARSPEYIAQLEADLVELSPLLLAEDSANGTQLSLEDILLFPILRGLTCVKGLVFPTNIEHYVKKMADLSQIDLYDDRAV